MVDSILCYVWHIFLVVLVVFVGFVGCLVLKQYLGTLLNFNQTSERTSICWCSKWIYLFPAIGTMATFTQTRTYTTLLYKFPKSWTRRFSFAFLTFVPLDKGCFPSFPSRIWIIQVLKLMLTASSNLRSLNDSLENFDKLIAISSVAVVSYSFKRFSSFTYQSIFDVCLKNKCFISFCKGGFPFFCQQRFSTEKMK
jgi:hypothetical protein